MDDGRGGHQEAPHVQNGGSLTTAPDLEPIQVPFLDARLPIAAYLATDFPGNLIRDRHLVNKIHIDVRSEVSNNERDRYLWGAATATQP